MEFASRAEEIGFGGEGGFFNFQELTEKTKKNLFTCVSRSLSLSHIPEYFIRISNNLIRRNNLFANIRFTIYYNNKYTIIIPFSTF